MADAPRSAPSGPTALLRGLTRRCPWCGSGHLFRLNQNIPPAEGTGR